jgi:hypothetical protein
LIDVIGNASQPTFNVKRLLGATASLLSDQYNLSPHKLKSRRLAAHETGMLIRLR